MTARYHRPTSLADALNYLATDPSWMVLAGGTDVYPARASRAGWGGMSHRPVLDISALSSLAGIERIDGATRIGALTTWSAIARADLPPAFAGLQAAAREVGGIQIQNRGTIGGNLCTASPAADGVPALLTLDATVELASQSGIRRIPLAEFLFGYRRTARRPDELLTAIIVPDIDGIGRFAKLGARRYLVISIAMAAVLMELDDDRRIRSVRIAVGACSETAQRMPVLERRLTGMHVDEAGSVEPTADDLAALAPIDDVRASADYRRAAAAHLVRDLLSDWPADRRRAA